MDEDPFSGYGLKPVELADRAVLEPYFSSLSEPLSDYTFSQLYTWRNSLRILWKQIDGHLCVFANGTGDLTLLMPPIGDTASDKAMRDAFELMDDYNAVHKVPDRSRVEYASEELLARFDRATLQLEPMGADYLYDVQRMIDLAGGDLASKRQAKNRFIRNYAYRVEPYSVCAAPRRLPAFAGKLEGSSGRPTRSRARRQRHQARQGIHRHEALPRNGGCFGVEGDGGVCGRFGV